MRVIYLEKLNAASLAAVIAGGHGHARIMYFDPGASGLPAARLLAALRLIKALPEAAQFTLRELTDSDGECLFLRIKEDVHRLSGEIFDRKIAVDPLYRRIISGAFDPSSLAFFLVKSVAEEINQRVIYLYAARDHMSKRLKPGETALFLLQRDLWSERLKNFAGELGLEARDYPGFDDSRALDYAKKFFTNLFNGLFSRAAGLFLRSSRPAGVNRDNLQAGASPTGGKPRIAVWYSGQSITFDVDKRSAFFWLQEAALPREDVLYYFSRPDMPLSAENARRITDAGIGCVAISPSARQSPGIPLWSPGKTARKAFASLSRLLLSESCREIIHGRFPPSFIIMNLANFARLYAFWLDFFGTFNIKVNLSANDFTKAYGPKNLALRRNGGISVSYQYSNLWFLSSEMTSCSDVMFAFGRDYSRVWKDPRSPAGQLVYNGYITDCAFSHTRGKAKALRARLEKSGARFVLCFFDENSSPDRLSLITNEESGRVYRFFLEKMLADPALGLIFKPGYPRTLRSRLGPIAKLFDAAAATGRCVLIDSGEYLTDTYPAEPAQAADLCVGLLLAGTAGMEAFLAGTPTVFLDDRRFYSHPLYKKGRGNVVFDRIEDMFIAIEKFRACPAEMPGFGDLSDWIDGKVRFRDGKSAARIGEYMGWLLEALKSGKDRKETIALANNRFTSVWGDSTIEVLRCS